MMIRAVSPSPSLPPPVAVSATPPPSFSLLTPPPPPPFLLRLKPPVSALTCPYVSPVHGSCFPLSPEPPTGPVTSRIVAYTSSDTSPPQLLPRPACPERDRDLAFSRIDAGAFVLRVHCTSSEPHSDACMCPRLHGAPFPETPAPTLRPMPLFQSFCTLASGLRISFPQLAPPPFGDPGCRRPEQCWLKSLQISDVRPGSICRLSTSWSTSVRDTPRMRGGQSSIVRSLLRSGSPLAWPAARSALIGKVVPRSGQRRGRIAIGLEGEGRSRCPRS